MSWLDDLLNGNGGYMDDDDEDDYGVGQVTIFCDRHCGTEFSGDFVGTNAEARFVAARTYLADHGWTITDSEDLCPRHPADSS